MRTPRLDIGRISALAQVSAIITFFSSFEMFLGAARYRSIRITAGIFDSAVIASPFVV